MTILGVIGQDIEKLPAEFKEFLTWLETPSVEQTAETVLGDGVKAVGAVISAQGDGITNALALLAIAVKAVATQSATVAANTVQAPQDDVQS